MKTDMMSCLVFIHFALISPESIDSVFISRQPLHAIRVPKILSVYVHVSVYSSRFGNLKFMNAR